MPSPEEKRAYKFISLKKKVTQSPFQLYALYGKFPWQFLVHCLLLFFCTYEFGQIIQLRNNYMRNQMDVFTHVLVENIEDDEGQFEKESIINTLEDMQDQLQMLSRNLYNLDGELLMKSDTINVDMFFTVYYSSTSNLGKRQLEFPLPREKLITGFTEPFDINDTDSYKDFLQEVDLFTITISGIKTRGSTNIDSSNCLEWEVIVEYDFSSFQHIAVTIEIEPAFCNDGNYFTQVKTNLFIHALVFCLSIISLLFGMNGFYKMWKNYRHYHLIHLKRDEFRKKRILLRKQTTFNLQKQTSIQKYNNVDEVSDSEETDSQASNGYDSDDDVQRIDYIFSYQKDFEEFSLWDKMVFFDPWLFIGVLGNILTIIGSLTTIVDLITPSTFTTTLNQDYTGIGASCIWLVQLYYLKFNPNIFGFMSALTISSMNIFWFIVALLPFFVGFTMLFESIYWKSEFFETTQSSFTMCFAMMSGDAVNDLFQALSPFGLLGIIFLIMFLILFFTSAQNILIAIIMEGYEKMIVFQKNKIEKYNQGDFSKIQAQRFIQKEINYQDMNIIQEIQETKKEEDNENLLYLQKKLENTKQHIDQQIEYISKSVKKYFDSDFGQSFEKKTSLKYQTSVHYYKFLQNMSKQVKYQQVRGNVMHSQSQLSQSSLSINRGNSNVL